MISYLNVSETAVSGQFRYCGLLLPIIKLYAETFAEENPACSDL